MENTPVIVPESMIKTEVEGRWRRLAQYYNTNVQTIAQMMTSGEGHEEREKEWRETAEKALHSRLIIETLIEEQNFDINDDDIEKELQALASENYMKADEFKKHYDEQALMYLKEEIKERRVIDMMLAENTFKPEKKENYLDFMTDNG
jgi:trigger factor